MGIMSWARLHMRPSELNGTGARINVPAACPAGAGALARQRVFGRIPAIASPAGNSVPKPASIKFPRCSRSQTNSDAIKRPLGSGNVCSGYSNSQAVAINCEQPQLIAVPCRVKIRRRQFISWQDRFSLQHTVTAASRGGLRPWSLFPRHRAPPPVSVSPGGRRIHHRGRVISVSGMRPYGEQAILEQIDHEDSALCSKFGLATATPHFSDCLIDLADLRQRHVDMLTGWGWLEVFGREALVCIGLALASPAVAVPPTNIVPSPGLEAWFKGLKQPVTKSPCCTDQ